MTFVLVLNALLIKPRHEGSKDPLNHDICPVLNALLIKPSGCVNAGLLVDRA